MEWKSNLRRVQSLRSVPSSCDQPTWTEAGQRDKTTSVSRLVTRYQTTVEVNTSIQEMSGNNSEAKQNRVLKEITPSLLESKETHLEDLLWRNNERELSRAKTNLTRSKSMGNLQNSAGSIESLKALFEANGATQTKARHSFRDVRFPSTYKAADIKPEMNGEFKEVKKPAEKPKTQIPSDALVNDVKDDHVTRKVVNQTQIVRRKTIGGIDFEKLAASQAGEYQKAFIRVCSVMNCQP
ncbi:uncharacterized protein LOC113744515 [Larimichthys crocea]|uniref:uncharacterized protein LOC113744515 n=1 Tax=Larimichthys crocea TaxID=215358 RepID=UPI000F5FF145|nr:uncharacterized protein LOC113744515 [Larimichthys crocea]